MDKIKVGEYIRFKDGKIRKIISQDVDNHLIVDTYIYGGNWLTLNEQENIVKHSSNIIDLIEVGDYVNGEKVIEVSDYKDWIDIGAIIREYHIKSIVTKEQFKSVEYRLED